MDNKLKFIAISPFSLRVEKAPYVQMPEVPSRMLVIDIISIRLYFIANHTSLCLNWTKLKCYSHFNIFLLFSAKWGSGPPMLEVSPNGLIVDITTIVFLQLMETNTFKLGN